MRAYAVNAWLNAQGNFADTLGEFGRTIRIIRRDIVKNGSSPITVIACSNFKGVLKPKGNLINRWCCYEKDVWFALHSGTVLVYQDSAVKIS